MKYSSKIDPVKLAASVAYADFDGSKSESIDDQMSGSFSILHQSGFNITLASGNRNFDDSDRSDTSFFYGKFGYRRDSFSYGMTALALEWGRWSDSAVTNDEADVFGVLLVQDIADWGTEYSFGFRNHMLDRTNNPRGLELYDILNAAWLSRCKSGPTSKRGSPNGAFRKRRCGRFIRTEISPAASRP